MSQFLRHECKVCLDTGIVMKEWGKPELCPSPTCPHRKKAEKKLEQIRGQGSGADRQVDREEEGA